MSAVPDPLRSRIERWLATPRPMLIGEQWVDASDQEPLRLHDPALGTLLATSVAAGARDVDAAVRAARVAFEDGRWSAKPGPERAKILWRVAELIEQHAAELALLETLNNGKPLRMASMADVPSAARTFRYYAGWCDKLGGRTANVALPNVHAYTRREPIGVCALIVPWNFPLLMAAWKLAPCLAAGNTAVLKPAEDTPLTALRLGELLLEAGVPPGVVNIVPGTGDAAGAALAAHHDVDKLAFTGSTAVGRQIVAAAAGNLKRLTLELGGKSPNVVFADADVPAAIAGAARSIFYNAGQVCVAGARLYVEHTIYERVVEGVVDAARKLRVGSGLDQTTDMGPLASERHLQRVARLVDDGLRAGGGRVLTGGSRSGEHGWFYAPTVIAGTKPGTPLLSDEIFGPVLSVDRFDDFASAIRHANDSAFGLAANVWTKNLDKAHAAAATLKAGTIWVNSPGALDLNLPFGGLKQSGWGKEFGEESLAEYTSVKSVLVQASPVA